MKQIALIALMITSGAFGVVPVNASVRCIFDICIKILDVFLPVLDVFMARESILLSFIQ